ncbi:hypothetical protein LMH87_002502 [Akanthomyces muscarius]|uniref:Uncharacterized protein n=1 Tax=Akanthomyces muscarius TaxID=2231603 RepID=A0A9W8UJQ6_AKAMU|nr:hypothetical protein LMH87_002502 [Akanthomyces muscarius]KAJ4148013.1 hypothetical protein LMH87_002502 [Akanthomyces muscarius]
MGPDDVAARQISYPSSWRLQLSFAITGFILNQLASRASVCARRPCMNYQATASLANNSPPPSLLVSVCSGRSVTLQACPRKQTCKCVRW